MPDACHFFSPVLPLRHFSDIAMCHLRSCRFFADICYCDAALAFFASHDAFSPYAMPFVERSAAMLLICCCAFICGAAVCRCLFDARYEAAAPCHDSHLCAQ